MIREILIALLVALFVSIINLKLLWHLIWPKWKAYGKFIMYITISIIGTYFIGKLIYIYILGYPFFGLLIHIFWCKKYGMDWKNIDKDKFIESQKEFYGYKKIAHAVEQGSIDNKIFIALLKIIFPDLKTVKVIPGEFPPPVVDKNITEEAKNQYDS